VSELLVSQWGIAGYLRWLRGLRAQYTMRRDFTVDCFADAFDIGTREESGVTVIICSAGGKQLFEMVPPRGGMFIWVRSMIKDTPES
jgi:aromatic amino acid aminotransferase I